MVCCLPIISLISTFSLGCAYGSGYFCSQQFCGKVKDKTTGVEPTTKKSAEVIVNTRGRSIEKSRPHSRGDPRSVDPLRVLELWKQDLKLSIKEKVE